MKEKYFYKDKAQWFYAFPIKRNEVERFYPMVGIETQYADEIYDTRDIEGYIYSRGGHLMWLSTESFNNIFEKL